jgi:hypothetical protein
MSEDALAKHHSSVGGIPNEIRQLLLERLSHRISEIKKDPGRLTLLSFFRVLLDHHVLAEDAANKSSELSRASYIEKQNTLTVFLEQLSGGVECDLPSILQGVFDIAALKGEVGAHRNAVEKENFTEGELSDKPMSLDCHELARSLMVLATAGQAMYDLPITPWTDAVMDLKRKWEGPSFEAEMMSPEGEFTGYLREWIVREGVFDEPNDMTKELARLNRLGVQTRPNRPEA